MPESILELIADDTRVFYHEGEEFCFWLFLDDEFRVGWKSWCMRGFRTSALGWM